MSEQRLQIEALGRRGEGIARSGGHTLYVPYALPGETVRAELDGDKARLVAVETPSPDRVAPFCDYFGRCGGCLLQHVQENAYRDWKRGLIEAALRHRGLAAPVAPLIDAHGAGRRRVALHVRKYSGQVTAGFMGLRSHHLQDIAHCPILVPELTRGPDVARAIGAIAGNCDVNLTATAGGIDAAVKLERNIAAHSQAKLTQLAEMLDLARLSVNGEVLAQRRVPSLRMGPADVVPPPGGFLQATAAGEEALAELVLAALPKSKQVADLFCGVGPFALRIAARARVSAFDSDRAAVAALTDATRRAAGLKPIAAAARDLSREPLVAGELKDFDAVVFDPPRAGAEAQAKQLARSKVPLVVAVSCEPATLARDAAILVAGGYTLEGVTPVDQFKWSAHVEAVAVLRRR
jgi:23S rRNA (uracil1939-C5)-methyltransferase